MPYSILIADDHPVVRSGYQRLISLHPELSVVAEFNNGEDTYFWCKENKADLLIIDISMPGQGGLETVRKIRMINSEIIIIMLSMFDAPSLISKAISYGANDFLSKTCDSDDLIDTILVALKVPHVSVNLNKYRSMQRAQTDMLHEELSPREFLVMLKLSEGLSVKDVAEIFNISDKTVYNYQTKIYKKLKVENGIQLNQYVKNNGLRM